MDSLIMVVYISREFYITVVKINFLHVVVCLIYSSIFHVHVAVLSTFKLIKHVVCGCL